MKKYRFTILFICINLGFVACKEKNLPSGKDHPKIITKNTYYSHAGKPLQGYLAHPKKWDKKKPGILLIHEWTGLGDYVKKRSNMLARLGYVAFAMDMYGKGIRAKDHKEAAALMGKYLKKPGLMLGRMKTSLDILKSNPMVDTNNIAVIGYCFGGKAALMLAYSGEDIKGIVSFHGSLEPPNNKEANRIKTKLLIHHGAEDKFIPAKKVEQFREALKKANVDLTFVSHKGAVHGFTRWSAGNDKSTGIAYNKEADESSWKSMQQFFKTIFQ